MHWRVAFDRAVVDWDGSARAGPPLGQVNAPSTTVTAPATAPTIAPVIESSASRYLLCRAGARLCALPVEQVLETMRPLPIEPLAATDAVAAGLPLLGLARVRGGSVPVVDLAALLEQPAQAVERFVLLRVAERRVALAVGAVLGVRTLAPAEALPPLLGTAAQGSVEALSWLDDQLLLRLDAARLVPAEEPVAAAVAAVGAAS